MRRALNPQVMSRTSVRAATVSQPRAPVKSHPRTTNPFTMSCRTIPTLAVNPTIVTMAEVEAENRRGPSTVKGRLSNDCIQVCPKHLTPQQCQAGGTTYTCCKASDGYYWCEKQACVPGVGCDIQVTWRPGVDPEPSRHPTHPGNVAHPSAPRPSSAPRPPSRGGQITRASMAVGRRPNPPTYTPGCAPGQSNTGDNALDWLRNSACC